MKSLKQRNKYIQQKTLQLDKITDAHRYTHRLSRIMRYHNLLTEIEMAEVKSSLK